MSDNIELTLEEQATNAATREHILQVGSQLHKMIILLMSRAEVHDQSKLVPPEVDTFTEFTPKLRGTTYGSDEYEQFRKDMKPALDHHYANNSHHPEYYENGFSGMDLIDLVEMLCDWKAATMRHADGDINKSLEINRKRFNMDDQLYAILKNTVARHF